MLKKVAIFFVAMLMLVSAMCSGCNVIRIAAKAAKQVACHADAD